MFASAAPRPADLKELAKRERTRQIEEQRKPRIFNARRRLIGIDTEGLQQQISEKKALEELKRTEDKAYHDKMVRDIELANRLESQVIQSKKQLLYEINEFRKNYQRKEDRREFDLYDPELLKKSLPCRLGDDDPRLSISSAQKFEGEESCSGEKKKIKVEQQRYWLVQQMAERKQQMKEKALAENIYTEAVVARDKRVQLLEQMEKDCKKQLASSIASYNKALAAEQAQAKKMQTLRDLEDKQTDIFNNLTSDFLTENPEVAFSNLGMNKMIGSMYKGMTAAQKEEIRNIQAQQREELKAKKAEQDQFERDWEKFSTSIAQKTRMEEEKLASLNREKVRKLTAENEQLRREQKAHQEYLKKVVYTNSPTAAFYGQFNKTTR